MSPYGEVTAPPLSVVSPFQSCHAQNWPVGVLYPSGWVPCGDTMMYWASRFEAAVVLPKWAGRVDRLNPELVAGGRLGEAVLSSTHTPASTPPEG